MLRPGISVGIQVKHLKGDWHLEVQPFLNLWKTLNKGTNLIELPTVKHPADSNRQPIDAFIDQELNFAIQLVKNIHKSLATVNQAIRGNTRPSLTVSDTVFHLLQLQVIAANPLNPFKKMYDRRIKTMLFSDAKTMDGSVERSERFSHIRQKRCCTNNVSEQNECLR